MNKRLALLLLFFVVGCTPNINTVQISSTPVPTSTPFPNSTPTITPTSTLTSTPTPAFISYETVFNIVPIKTITGESLSNNKQFNVIAFSPDLNTYATFYYDDKILIIWNAITGQKISTISAKDVTKMVFSPDGRTIATIAIIDNQFALALYDSATGEQIRALPCRGYTAVFSSDSKIFFTSYEACDVATGQLLYSFDCPRNLVCYNAAVSPDGKVLATTSDVGRTKGTHEVVLWDTITGEQIARLDGNIYPADVGDSSPILAIAFSPDGKYIASTDSRNATIIWNIATREKVSVFDPISRNAGIRSIEASDNRLIL